MNSMRMLPPLCCLVVLAGTVPGQDVPEQLARAGELIAATELEQALDILLSLVDRAGSREEASAIAVQLQDAGRKLEDRRTFAPALRAFEACVRVVRSHGVTDDASVATFLGDLARCLEISGNPVAALPRYAEQVAMRRRLAAGRDEAQLAISLNNHAVCLRKLGRWQEALPLSEETLAMRRRLYGEGDHAAIAVAENNLALCLLDMRRDAEALPRFEASLAMRERLAAGRDDAAVATGELNLGLCLCHLARYAEAVPHCERALAVRIRVNRGADDPGVALCHSRLGSCLRALHRSSEALEQFDLAVAMWRRLGMRDGPELVPLLHNRSLTLEALGRPAEMLQECQAALTVALRVYGGMDHPDLASCWRARGVALNLLGRTAAALPDFQRALDMERRLAGGRDSDALADRLNDLAFCLHGLGRLQDASTKYLDAFEMRQRLHGDDSASIAPTLVNIGCCLREAGESELALKWLQKVEPALARSASGDDAVLAAALGYMAQCCEALGRPDQARRYEGRVLPMLRRILGDGDHPQLAAALDMHAQGLLAAGELDLALATTTECVAMFERLYGHLDHKQFAAALAGLARAQARLGRLDEARRSAEQACGMAERLFAQSRSLGADTRHHYFDALKRSGMFEVLQSLLLQGGEADAAFAVAERSRGRDLLDLLEQQRFEPLDEAERRARLRGDEATTARIGALRLQLVDVAEQGDRLLSDLAAIGDHGEAQAKQRRDALSAAGTALSERRQHLCNERARLVADVLPVGRPWPTADIQASLQDGELLLEFAVQVDRTIVYVVPPASAPVRHHVLGPGDKAVTGAVDAWLAHVSHAQLTEPARGRDPGQPATISTNGGLELFRSLFPDALWQQVRNCRRVWIAAHRGLHRLPFETLVIDQAKGGPRYWLDVGPPIVYVPSGGALHWLRHRQRDAEASSALDLLAVGDPQDETSLAELPEQGVLVIAVNDGSPAAASGLLPGDVMVAYDGKPLADDTTLRTLQQALQAAIEDGARRADQVELRYWRRGELHDAVVAPGRLDVRTARGPARRAAQARADLAGAAETVTRSGDLEELGKLPRLSGARAEVQAIAGTFPSDRVRTLLGLDARETAVRELAGKARFLHFACHGIAAEFGGQSLSMLVLSRPKTWLPGDDGHLQLQDLLAHWRGQLSACELVVLSACRTNVGPQFRDDAPQALPIGFLFAGANAVIASLWTVDDASTAALMTDFYGRMEKGETDRLAAFTAARKALRSRQPDPFFWSPFLYNGAPE